VSRELRHESYPTFTFPVDSSEDNDSADSDLDLLMLDLCDGVIQAVLKAATPLDVHRAGSR
jgi:hypothetical protein